MFFQTDKDAIEYCKKYENAKLLADSLCNKDNSGKGWLCSCGSGSGKHGTGINLSMSRDGKGDGFFHCFACNWGGDIFSLYQHEKDCDFFTAKIVTFAFISLMIYTLISKNTKRKQRINKDHQTLQSVFFLCQKRILLWDKTDLTLGQNGSYFGTKRILLWEFCNLSRHALNALASGT